MDLLRQSMNSHFEIVLICNSIHIQYTSIVYTILMYRVNIVLMRSFGCIKRCTIHDGSILYAYAYAQTHCSSLCLLYPTKYIYNIYNSTVCMVERNWTMHVFVNTKYISKAAKGCVLSFLLFIWLLFQSESKPIVTVYNMKSWCLWSVLSSLTKLTLNELWKFIVFENRKDEETRWISVCINALRYTIWQYSLRSMPVILQFFFLFVPIFRYRHASCSIWCNCNIHIYRSSISEM